MAQSPPNHQRLDLADARRVLRLVRIRQDFTASYSADPITEKRRATWLRLAAERDRDNARERRAA